MTVSKYAIRFSELSRHVPALVSIVREQLRRLIEVLNYGLSLVWLKSWRQILNFSRLYRSLGGWSICGARRGRIMRLGGLEILEDLVMHVL